MLACGGAIVAASGMAGAATTDVSGTLFYTTFSSLSGVTLAPATVQDVTFNWSGGVLKLGTPATIVSLPSGQNADGIIFDSGGNLLVGSAGINIPPLSVTGTNQIISYNTTGSKIGSATTPTGPFHLTLSPDGTKVYSAGTFGPVTTPLGTFNLDGDTPGPLVSTASNLSGAGTTVSTSGSDTTFTQLAFNSAGTAFYTSSPATGTGSYGTLNLATGVSTRIGTSAAAHGVFFDPFSGTVILTGANVITQLDATTGAVLSSVTLGTQFQLDQGTADGHGHLLIGDNNGDLVLVDLTSSATQKSLTGSTIVETPLSPSLDDLAPLDSFGPPVTIPPSPPSPPGPPPPPSSVPLPASAWMGMTVLAPLALMYARRRKQRQQSV